jgi:hypothetical protein
MSPIISSDSAKLSGTGISLMSLKTSFMAVKIPNACYLRQTSTYCMTSEMENILCQFLIMLKI